MKRECSKNTNMGSYNSMRVVPDSKKINYNRMKLISVIPFIAILLATIIGGCKDENVGTVGVCPQVLSTNPVNLAVDVPIDQVVTVTFNEKMNPATISQAAFSMTSPDTTGNKKTALSKTTTIVTAGNVAYNNSNYTMSFTPNNNLTINTTYTVTVSSSIKDLMGNALQANYVWTFSTGATTSPTVSSMDPANNTTDVVLNKTVTATFSMPMDPLTLTTTTFTVKQGTTVVAGTVSITGTMASFKPTVPFTAGTVYLATITSGAKNVNGVSLQNDNTWTFTTGTTIAPSVNLVDPLNAATGVAFNKVLIVTFSGAMDNLTITNSNFTLMNGSTAIAGTVNYSGTTATFTPTSSLLSGTTYTATVTTGAKDMAGTPLANNYVWNFSTIDPLGPLVVDLKSVSRFGIIAGVGVSNDAGASVINNMDVGIYPGVRSSITGFPPATIVNGAIYASDDISPPGVPAMLLQAKTDLTNAYLFAEAAVLPAPATVSGDQGGKTLAPGIYKSTSTLLIQSGDLTLDAQGDVNAVWIFQIASDFTTVGGAGGNIILIGGAQAKNIFWQTGRSATIGNGTIFQGNVLALTSITMNSGAVATGRMLARNGSVVMTSTNTINKP